MQYNLSYGLDRERFEARIKHLMQKGCVVELTERTSRTLSQNAYLHLCIGVVAMEVGERLEYVKDEYYKKLVNRSLYVIEKNDPLIGRVEVLRSSSDLTIEEMSLSIDRFKKWASENGMYVPNPEDRELLRDIEIEMGRMKQWL